MDSNKNKAGLKDRSLSNHFESIQSTSKTSSRVQTADDNQDHGESNENRILLTIFASLVIDLLAFTVILPLLPSLLEFYGRQKQDTLYNAMMDRLNYFKTLMGMPEVERFNGVLFGGILGSLFSFLQFLCCPLFGAASDLYGRKITLLVSMAGVLLSYVIWAASQNFSLFVVARIIGGLSKGNVTICTAAVTDVTSMKTRSKGMALVGVAYSIGFIVGPTIGAVFASRSSIESGNLYYLPAVFASVLILVDIIFVLCCFKDTLPPEKRVNDMTITGNGSSSVLSEVKKAFYYINPVSLFKFSALERSSISDLKTVRSIGVVYFLFLLFFSGLEFTLTFLTHTHFKYTSMKQGMMFFFIGIIMATVQGGYVRRSAPGSEKKTTIKGIVAIMPGMFLVGIAKTPFVLYCGLAFVSFGKTINMSRSKLLIIRHRIIYLGTDDQKGKIMGIFRSLGALARGLGPFVFCSAYWCVGAFWCYLTGALIFLVPLFLLVKNVPSHKTEKSNVD
ncbi:hypothetical protein QZH41_015318 [Actinostola sp. cb2023]|nr:hypothetical protein QZH41_015318 [Actinostola sp. cb2023]